MAINSWDKGLREENEALKQQLMIAGKGGSPGQPYDEYKSDENERKYLDGLYDKLKRNKETGKDPVDVFKDGIQGELFSRKPPDRGALRPWTKGKNPWDDAGGEPIDALKQFPALYKIIMQDAAAG